MKLNKLAFIIASTLILTACGSSSSSSSESSSSSSSGSNSDVQTQTYSKQIQVDRYSTEDIELLTPASPSNTIVCFDTNNDNSCIDEKISKTLDSSTGVATLEWNADDVDVNKAFVIAQNSAFIYKIKDVESASKLYINPLTDAATRLGNEVLKDIIGYDGDINDFLPINELNPDLTLLSDCIGKLTENLTSPDGVYNEDEFKVNLEGLYTTINNLSELGYKPAQIVANVLFDIEDTDTPPKPNNNVPVSNFEYSIGNDGTVSFTNISTDPDSDSLVYKWYFGDGFSSDEESPTHRYSINGTYTVELQVTDGSAIDVMRKDVVVTNIADDAIVLEPSFVLQIIEKTVHLSDLSKIEGVTDVTYIWDFGDGSTSSEKEPIYEYKQAGNYEISLQLESNGIKSEVFKAPIVITDFVYDFAPLIEVSFDAKIVGSKVLFEPIVNYSGTMPDRINYIWQFGDGQVSVEKNPMHSYSSPGKYTVILAAGDGLENDIHIQTITIEETSSETDSDVIAICPLTNPYCKGAIDPEECIQVCDDDNSQECQSQTLPDYCYDVAEFEMQVEENVAEVEKEVVIVLTAYTGYTGVNFEWSIDGYQPKMTMNYAKDTKGLVFERGKISQEVTITINASNATGTKTSRYSKKFTIPAAPKSKLEI